MGLPEIRANNDWIVGPPLWDSFSKIGVADDQLDHAVDLYRERYRDIGYLENALYDGVLDQLSRLKDHSFTLCLATSKAAEYAVKITDLLKHGLDVTNKSAKDAVMVGDRSFDILGALANEMAAFGVLYGYGNQDELEGAVAHSLITFFE